MPIQVLVMPGGEFDGQHQHVAVATIKQLADAGTTGWAVQAVMPTADPPMRFIRNWPTLTPGWRFMKRPTEIIQWFVDRRNRQIGEALGVTGFDPVFTVTDYECQNTTDPELYDAAVAKVTQMLDTDGLYGSGIDRFQKEFDHPRRLERLQREMSSTVLFPTGYFKFNYEGGRVPRPIDDTIKWAESRGQTVWPYVSGAYAGENGGGLVPMPLLRDGLKRMIDAGAAGLINWVDMTNQNAVRDVKHLFDAAGSVN